MRVKKQLSGIFIAFVGILALTMSTGLLAA